MPRSPFYVTSRLLIALLICVPVASAADRLGFDRNDFPGDAALPALGKSFAYTGYWLNAPPGTKLSTWLGKRDIVKRAGLGFLILFNGRLEKDLKTHGHPNALGDADAKDAAATAVQEGFPPGAIIFLDQEEGGRLLPDQREYLFAWIDGIVKRGFRAGVYCSGMPSHEPGGVVLNTAADIHDHAGTREIAFFVYNDACPPSPGCSLHPGSPATSGIPFAVAWQYAQSPRRAAVTAACAATYSPSGSCLNAALDVDLSVALSGDPSRGR